MKFARFSVHRPVFVTMCTSIVLILGGISLSRLPIDLMPDITNPTLSVSTSYENASPQEVEELIARPIEEAVSAVPGVERITSTCSEGSANVRVQFSWGTDLDAAANDVRDRLDRVVGRLPDEANRPMLRKFDVAAFPILILGASSDLDAEKVRKIVEDQIKFRIERIPGVAALDIRGGQAREIHVDLDIDKVKALELSLDQVLSRVRLGNVDFPAGTIERGNLEVRVRTPGAYSNLDELGATVLAVRQGVAVRLRDVASIRDTFEKQSRFVRIDGKDGIGFSVSKQSGTNTVQVAREVLAELEKINRDIPQIEIIPIIDTSLYIERSIRNVTRSATMGGGLAIVVLLAFLRNVLSTFIIAVSIPVSIVATFVMIYFGGFTLNIMTLGGLALGVGMLVDNSIVVLENVTRLRNGGKGREAAAVDGAEEVTAAIIASTLTTIVVFLPLVFLGGVAGVMFKQLSLVVGFALLCSLVSAITIVPMLASKVLNPTAIADGVGLTVGQRLFRASARFFSALEKGYHDFLGVALDHRLLVVSVCVALLGASLALVPLIGYELMPQADEGEVRVDGEMEVGTRAEVVAEKFREVERIVSREVPEMEKSVEFLGGARSRGSHTAQMRITLKPERQRTRSSEQIARELGPKLSAGAPGIELRTRAGQGLFLLRVATQGSDRLEVEIRGHEFEVADVLADQVKAIVQEVDGVSDVRVTRESGSPEEVVVIDRLKAADMLLTVSDIAEMLRTALAGSTAGEYREGGDEYTILVKVAGADKMRLSDILDLTITNAQGRPVVLRNVVSVRPRLGPVTIERKDQERTATVRANIEGRDMGSVIRDIQDRLRRVAVPAGFSISFAGDYEEQQKAFRDLMLTFVLALILVYMVMACQYESLRDPFVVMFAVPFAAIGVTLTLFLTHTTFNIQSFIGCIMLGGIVVNNAILLVDHTNLLRRRDAMPLREAIEEAGRRRLRPILMTAMTTSLGLLPLAIGLGEGSEAQAPLARAVIGGLASSALVTLVLVPVVYSIFEQHMTPQKQAPGPRNGTQAQGEFENRGDRAAETPRRATADR
ncbi:efflux RND transporter permease subunit [Candidatus Sumerlaeota bacterium]|nr:efflux RND transporter permease subunit [Candidatus Sumerlaeota bacterium]